MLNEHDIFDTVFFQMTRELLREAKIVDLATARNYDLDDLGFQLSYILYCGKDWQRRIAMGTTNIKLYPLIHRFPGDQTPFLSKEEYHQRVEEAKKEFDPEPALPYIREDFYAALESFRGEQGKHYYTVVDKSRLERFIMDNHNSPEISGQKENRINNKPMVVSELVSLAGHKINSLLPLCSAVNDIQIRKFLRTGLLAQMYGINETNQGDGSPYFVMVNDSCAILQTEQFSFVLKPDGNLKMTPYHFKLDDSRPSKWGWQTCAIKNQIKKYGLYSLEGQELLPCEYDDVNIWDYDSPVVTIDGDQFKVTINSGNAEIVK